MLERDYGINELDEYDKFLGTNFDCGDYLNWDCGRFRYCRYSIMNGMNHGNEESWIPSFQRFEDQGKLVGFVHTEEPHDYFMQIQKEYKFLEREMLEYCLADAKKKNPERTSIVLTAGSKDAQRIQLFESFGGKRLPDEDFHRIGKLSAQEEKARSIKQNDVSFRVERIQEMDQEALQELVRIYHEVWTDCNYFPSTDTPKRILCPNSHERNIIWAVYDAKDRMVGFTCGFGQGNQEYIDLYPITVLGEFAEQGATRALLAHAILDSLSEGYSYATLSAYYEERDEKDFKNMGFELHGMELSYEIPILGTFLLSREVSLCLEECPMS